MQIKNMIDLDETAGYKLPMSHNHFRSAVFNDYITAYTALHRLL